MTSKNFLSDLDYIIRRKWWQHSARDLMVRTSHIDDGQLRFDLFDYFDRADFSRIHHGTRAEFTEHSKDPGLDEFSDIFFYAALEYMYIDTLAGGLDRIKYDATPVDDSEQFLAEMDQPVRNLLRPSGKLKDKHLEILVRNMERFMGALFAHARFRGYTEKDILGQLTKKLDQRYPGK